jgi:hypothetical protein
VSKGEAFLNPKAKAVGEWVSERYAAEQKCFIFFILNIKDKILLLKILFNVT